jgi:two-component system, NarL family, sensor kinase
MFTDKQEEYYSIILFTLFALLLITVIIISAILYHNRQRKHKQEKMKMKTEFDQALLLTQVEIQEQTLKNISEEIHDNVGQILSLAKLHLNTFPPMADTSIKNKLDEAVKLVSKAINDLRNLSRSLHGEKITDIGLQEAITGELNVLQNTGQFATRLVSNGKEYKLDNKKEMVLFRIVQEALHNAEKHSGASELWVEIQYTPTLFSLSVCDNGKGFDAASLNAVQKGIGLKSMQNRATLIGGKLNVRSSAGSGACINVELPLQALEIVKKERELSEII